MRITTTYIKHTIMRTIKPHNNVSEYIKLRDTTTLNTKSPSGMIAGAHTASQWPKPAYQVAKVDCTQLSDKPAAPQYTPTMVNATY